MFQALSKLPSCFLSYCAWGTIHELQGYRGICVFPIIKLIAGCCRFIFTHVHVSFSSVTDQTVKCKSLNKYRWSSPMQKKVKWSLKTREKHTKARLPLLARVLSHYDARSSAFDHGLYSSLYSSSEYVDCVWTSGLLQNIVLSCSEWCEFVIETNVNRGQGLYSVHLNGSWGSI